MEVSNGLAPQLGVLRLRDDVEELVLAARRTLVFFPALPPIPMVPMNARYAAGRMIPRSISNVRIASSVRGGPSA